MHSVRTLGMVGHDTDGRGPGCWCWPRAANDPELPLSYSTRKLPLICCGLLLEIPVSAYWQSIVWQVGA